MSRIGHVMILASAGSGKTYALTNRYVRLLAHGAKPERIAALLDDKSLGKFLYAVRALRDLEHGAIAPAGLAQEAIWKT